jgi:hypothetical protein
LGGSDNRKPWGKRAPSAAVMLFSVPVHVAVIARCCGLRLRVRRSVIRALCLPVRRAQKLMDGLRALRRIQIVPYAAVLRTIPCQRFGLNKLVQLFWGIGGSSTSESGVAVQVERPGFRGIPGTVFLVWESNLWIARDWRTTDVASPCSSIDKS